MKVYIANFTDSESVAAEIDDPSGPDLVSMASPQFYSVAAQLTDEWVASLMEAWKDECGYMMADWPAPEPSEWKMTHEIPTQGRENWVYRLDETDERVGGTIVIQAVETDN